MLSKKIGNNIKRIREQKNMPQGDICCEVGFDHAQISNIETGNDKMKREAHERQKGICARCGEHLALEEMEADHITPWHEDGKTNAQNCQILCKQDNRTKSGK